MWKLDINHYAKMLKSKNVNFQKVFLVRKILKIKYWTDFGYLYSNEYLRETYHEIQILKCLRILKNIDTLILAFVNLHIYI